MDDPRSYLDDNPTRFMPGNERKGHIPPDPFDSLVIGGAETSGFDLDDDISHISGCRFWHLLQLKVIEIV